MINLDKDAYQGNENQSVDQVDQAAIRSQLKVAGIVFDESFPSQLSNVGTSTRITLRRVTKTSRRITAGKQISLVHSSGVTVSRSGRSPREVLSAIDSDGHAEFSFDLFDQVPRSGDLFGWINDLNSLIKDQNVGLKEQEISSDNSSTANSCGQDKVTTVENSLNDKSTKEKSEQPTTGNSATGSKFLDVSHRASFSHMEASL